MMPSSTSTQPNQPRRKTALVLAGGGITGFLYEVGVLTALDELAGRALSNDFDVYVGTSAGASWLPCSPMVLMRRRSSRR